MCALYPSLFPSFGWPVENPADDEQNNMMICRENEPIDALISFPQPEELQIQLDRSASFTTDSGDLTVVKKLNHNASERDRRKKINSLYSSLRSLLPAADQSKKLSIPATVSRVVKYIPELQEQVERLVERKEELMSMVSRQDDVVHKEKQRKKSVKNSLSTVSSTRLSDREIMIQISMLKVHKSLLSDILLNLEEDGLLLLNASSFESSGGRIFYNLHLEVEGSYQWDYEVLSQKLMVL